MPPNNIQPNYDFILKDQQPASRKFSLPKLHGKTAAALIGLAIVLVLLIVVGLASRGSSSAKPVVSALARGNEIIRVSGLVASASSDPSVDALATTVSNSLTSQKAQLVKVVGTVSGKDLVADKLASTDTQLTAASQSGSVNSFYQGYLKQYLAKYQSDLQTAAQTAGPSVKNIIKNAEASNQVILNSL